MSEEVDDAALANCEACQQYMHCKTTLRFKCLARTLMENKPRKVRLPQRYALVEPHDSRSGECEMEEKTNGPWLLRHDVIAALKAAGVEIETDDKKGTK